MNSPWTGCRKEEVRLGSFSTEWIVYLILYYHFNQCVCVIKFLGKWEETNLPPVIAHWPAYLSSLSVLNFPQEIAEIKANKACFPSVHATCSGYRNSPWGWEAVSVNQSDKNLLETFSSNDVALSVSKHLLVKHQLLLACSWKGVCVPFIVSEWVNTFDLCTTFSLGVT